MVTVSADELDLCPDYDDTIDVDVDKIPDGCDPLIETETEERKRGRTEAQ